MDVTTAPVNVITYIMRLYVLVLFLVAVIKIYGEKKLKEGEFFFFHSQFERVRSDLVGREWLKEHKTDAYTVMLSQERLRLWLGPSFIIHKTCVYYSIGGHVVSDEVAG